MLFWILIYYSIGLILTTLFFWLNGNLKEFYVHDLVALLVLPVIWPLLIFVIITENCNDWIKKILYKRIW